MKHLIRLLFALLSINGAAAQSADAVFRMEMDTLGGAVRAGQDLLVGRTVVRRLRQGEVWINSVNNMDDRAAVSSFGCVRRTKLLLQKTIEQAGPGDD